MQFHPEQVAITDAMSLPQINVVQVCLEYVPSAGGSIITVMDIDRVFKTSIIAFTSADNMIQDQEWDQNVFRVPIRAGILGRRYSLPVFSAELHKAEMILRQADLVIFHELFRYHFQWAGLIARKAKIPYWVIPHGEMDPYVFTYRSVQKKIWLSAVGYPIMRCAQSVIFATERECEKALPYTQGCRTHVVHWPVEYLDISRRAEARAIVCARHSIPDEARVLFWIGRLHLSKRPLQTIEAFGQIRNPLIHLIMVGPDDTLTREDCERFCAEANICNVHIIGPVYGKEKYMYYMASDAYISLSFKENFNYTAAEAMSCALPVILSQGNDLAQELRDLNCGWMLKTIDKQECIDALNQFASLPQIVLDEMGLTGQQWARDVLSQETFAQTLCQLAEKRTI